MNSTDNNNIRTLIHYMYRDGFCTEEIAKRLGISVAKIKKLIKEDEEIAWDLKYLKMMTDFEVEDSLLKKALGTTVTEVKETEKSTGTETVRSTKEVQGETSAMQFWLKNRMPERWSDKSEDNKDTILRLEKIFESIDKQSKRCKKSGNC